MSELPEGWVSAQLENLTDNVSYGYTASSTHERVGPHLLRITDIQENKVNWPDVPFCRIDESKKDKYLLRKGDLVFARTGATVGKSFLIRNEIPESVFASYLIRVRCTTNEITNYLSHYFNSGEYWKQITDCSSGIGQPNVNGSKLKGLRIPIPPLAEQTRIAQKLDELLTQVDTLKARIDAIPVLLNSFRQSIVSAAVSGQLTEEWRVHNSYVVDEDSLKKDRLKILGSKLESSLIPDSQASHLVPSGWIKCKFGELCDIRHGFAFQSKFFSDSGPIVLTPGNFTETGDLDFKEKRVVKLKGEYNKKWELVSGDILIVMTDLSLKKLILGKVVKLFSTEVVLHNQRIGKVVPFGKEVFSDFLRLSLLSPKTKQIIDETATGTVVQHTSPKKILDISTMLPPLAEQLEIVRRVEQLFAFADQLEAKVAAAKNRIDHLTQSILAKAFRGELVPQDPNDEPASVLLERIKAQRAAAPKVKRGRKASV